MCRHLGISAEDASSDRCQQAPEDTEPLANDGAAAQSMGRALRTALPAARVPTAQHTSPSQQAESIAAVAQPDGCSEFDWAQASMLLDMQGPEQVQDQDFLGSPSYGEGAWDVSTLFCEDFSLTGVLELDWAEFGRQVMSYEDF